MTSNSGVEADIEVDFEYFGEQRPSDVVGLTRRQIISFRKGVRSNIVFLNHPNAVLKIVNSLEPDELLAQLLVARFGVKVPRVYHAFITGGALFILMEKIVGVPFEDYIRDHPEEEDAMLVALTKPLLKMFSIPVPRSHGQRPDAAGGGYLIHPFFSEFGDAYVEYKSIEDLSRHINKILQLHDRDKYVDFSREPKPEKLMFYYGDIHGGNFIVTPNKEIYVVDFGQTGFLPESFVAFTFFNTAFRTLLAQKISELIDAESQEAQEMARFLKGLPRENVRAMQIASGRIRRTSEDFIAQLHEEL
ncbi:hypothetical protein EIP91_006274 [Steccherinum ochraceum]|uniref:Aminoglycoside phosphotransferase domain-containing protein n=1 Tax=Steccherinum ochraceum TaxID=92696 RepID=A0A4R0RGP5_9APHY|nr:hypothetical protein EIP91_006274 [Steccherinum ochraceum]